MSICIPTTCIQWDRESHSWAILASQWYNSKVTLVVIVKPSMWRIISQANYRLTLVQLAHTCRKSPWYSLTFSSCHRFSIGLASGLSGRIRHQFTPFWSKNAFAILEVCFGSLSCIKWWLFSYSGRWSVGRRATCRICTYIGASIMPSKTHAPCHPIPAHTCTFTGCFAQGFGWGRSPFFLQQNLLWHSSCTVVSSDHTTSSVVMKVSTSSFEPFLFVRLTNQLAVPWPSVRPAQFTSAPQDGVTATYGHAAASMNVFELQLLRHQLALSLRWSSEGHRCARSAFQILFACQRCQSQDSVCGNVHCNTNHCCSFTLQRFYHFTVS